MQNGKVQVLSSHDMTSTTADYEIVRKMRASNPVLVTLLARHHPALLSLPGGRALGARPMDLHHTAMAALGSLIELLDR